MIVTELPDIKSKVVGVDIETTGLRWDQDHMLLVSVSDGVDAWTFQDNFHELVPLLEDESVIKIFHNSFFDVAWLNYHLGCRTLNVYDTLIIERVLHNGRKGIYHGLKNVLARRCGVTLNKDIRKQFIGKKDFVFTTEQIDYAEKDVLYLPEVRRQQLDEAKHVGMEQIVILENLIILIMTEAHLRGITLDVDLYRENVAWAQREVLRIEKLLVPYLDEYVDQYTYDLNYKKQRQAYQEAMGVDDVEIWEVIGEHLEKVFSIYRPQINFAGKEWDDFNMFYDYLTLNKGKTFQQALESIMRKLTIEQRELDIVHPMFVRPSDHGFELSVNVNSSDQLGLLLNTVGIEVESTGKDVLEAEFNTATGEQKTLLQHIMNWKLWKKRTEWYYDTKLFDTGFIHPEWKTVRPITGRMACSNPNMQNVGRPKENEPNFRHCFTPRPGYSFVIADYSQQEPRALAQITQDPAFIEACNSDDVYLALAEKLYGYRPEKDSEERSFMKVWFLAAVYGANAAYFHKKSGEWRKAKLAKLTNTDPEEAYKIYQQMRKQFSKAFAWGDNQINFLKNNGFLVTRLGRRSYYPHVYTTSSDDMWKLENQARNSPPQGTGADMLKVAITYIWEEIREKKLDAHILLQVHDELGVEVKDEQAEEVREIVERNMVKAGKDLCPDVEWLAPAQVSKLWEK